MDTLEKALGPLEGSETWGLRIYRWQDKILKEELVRRHNKELEPVVELMKQVPELPDGFYDWLCTEGVARFDYALYTPPKGKKTTDMQCTCCGAKLRIDVKTIRPALNKRGTCPSCGRAVTWKTVTSKLNRTHRYWGYDEPWYAAIIQRMGDGIILRTFYVDVEFVLEQGECKGRKVTWGEVARDLFSDDVNTSYHSYEMIRYKNQGSVRWAPSENEYETGKAFLYTDNLPEVLNGTVWQYSGLADYQRKAWPHRIPAFGYLIAYPQKPFLEYFSKMGMRRMITDVLSSWGYGKNILIDGGKKPEEILGIPKQDIKTLIKHDGGFTMLEILHAAWLGGIRLSEEELLRYIRLFGSSSGELRPVYADETEVDIHKRLKYFRKQAQKSFDREKWNRKYTKEEALLHLERNLWKDWKDYMGWLGLYMPECRKDLYYVLPPDLPKAHDRLMKIAIEQKEKAAAERRRKQEEAVNRFLAEMQETGGIAMETRGLLIRLPRDAEEIRREGEMQHHCVATYIDRVEKHETMILFVRRVEAPEIPFYTMEWKDGTVRQCRGLRNADMTPEVRAFVTAFERKMQDWEARQRVRVMA